MIRRLLFRLFGQPASTPVQPAPSWLDVRLAERRAARPIKAEAARRAVVTEIHNRFTRDTLIKERGLA